MMQNNFRVELSGIEINYTVSTKYQIPITDSSGTVYYLWLGFNDGVDWFISAKFVSDGGVEYTLTDGLFTTVPEVLPDGSTISDRCYMVEVDLSTYIDVTGNYKIPDITRGKFVLTIKIVKHFIGISLGTINIIGIPTRAYWQTIDQVIQTNILIHEIGHQIHMVDSTVATHYTGKNHYGHHCFKGLSATEQAMSSYLGLGASSTCVMFGETNGKTDFCDKCSDAIKKLDIDDGF